MSEVAQVTHSSPDGHIPQLRLPQFSHDWAISTIGNLAKIDTGNRDTQDRVNSGKYPFYVRSNTVERINEYAFDGEAILTSGDGVGVGKNFHYVVGKFNYHQRVYSIHNFTNSTNGKFIYYYFADKFYRRVSRLSAKNSVDSVRMSMISDMPISIPAKPEQQKIAAFLTAVDNKIEQLSKKQELLGEYKKGLMQQIFSQAIRFKADDGCDFPDWEEKSLGELFNYKNGGSFENEVVKDGLYNLITLNSITIDGELKNEHKKINSFDNSLKINDLIMVLSDVAHGNFLGLTAIIPEDNSYVLNQRMGALKSKGLNNVVFLRLLINYNQKYFKLHGQGSSQQNLSKGDILKFELLLPNRNEQQKIANFLSSIDTKIEQVGKQLDESKQFKKALLQQMFV